MMVIFDALHQCVAEHAYLVNVVVVCVECILYFIEVRVSRLSVQIRPFRPGAPYAYAYSEYAQPVGHVQSIKSVA